MHFPLLYDEIQNMFRHYDGNSIVIVIFYYQTFTLFDAIHAIGPISNALNPHRVEKGRERLVLFVRFLGRVRSGFLSFFDLVTVGFVISHRVISRLFLVRRFLRLGLIFIHGYCLLFFGI